MGCGNISIHPTTESKSLQLKPYPSFLSNKLPKTVINSFEAILQRSGGGSNKKKQPEKKYHKLEIKEQRAESKSENPELISESFVQNILDEEQNQRVVIDDDMKNQDGRESPAAPNVEDMFQESEENEKIDLQKLKTERDQKEYAAKEEAKIAAQILKEKEDFEISKQKLEINAIQGAANDILSKYR